MVRTVFIVGMASCSGRYACNIACKDRSGLPDEFDLYAWKRMSQVLTHRPVYITGSSTASTVQALPALKYEQSQNRVPDPDFDDRGIGPAVLYLRRTTG